MKSFHKFRSFGNAGFHWIGGGLWVWKVSYKIVRRWRQKFLTGTESVNDEAMSCWPVTATGKANVSKVRYIVEPDGRYTILDIANAVVIPLLRAHFFFKAYFESTTDFFQMYTAYIDRLPKNGFQYKPLTAKQIFPRIQLTITCKYCDWWRNMS